jgi:SulP family sulfate permease
MSNKVSEKKDARDNQHRSPPAVARRQTTSSPKEASKSDQFRANWAEMARYWITDWRDVAKSRSLGSDLLAGLTVAAVALPLNLALAVASGMPPAAGLIAGSLGGAIAALFGGARLQVTVQRRP